MSTMTADEARTFAAGERVSSAVRVAAALAERARPSCTCRAYADVFTFRRWRAQGRTVRHGERGLALPVVLERTEVGQDELGDETSTTRRTLQRSYVFCRCQTDPLSTSPRLQREGIADAAELDRTRAALATRDAADRERIAARTNQASEEH